MKNKIRQIGVCSLFLLVMAGSCKKDVVTKLATNPLSINAPDLQARLAAIKRQYYDEKLGAKFIAKDEKGITWTPEWDKPRLEMVNDSVSYVFYRMIGKIKREGKLEKVQEIGAATYLMVKNERNFYKAFYYVPEEKRSKNPKDDTAERMMSRFSGTLLLSNLRGGRSYLLEYVDGQISEAYKKNQVASKKLQALGGAIAYWEQQCETLIRHCTFVSAGYSYCGGEIMVIYSYNCHWPHPTCGVTFYMTDSSEETVCQQVWFPDPPSGGGSGGSDEPLDEIEKLCKNCDCGNEFEETVDANLNLEPKWGQLGSNEDIKKEVNKITRITGFDKLSLKNKLEALQAHFFGDRMFVRGFDNKIVDAPGSKLIDRYVYTSKRGWVDMHHFFYAAYLSESYSISFAALFTSSAEYIQSFLGNQANSSFSYEDKPSNLAGIDFWLKYHEKIEDKTISIENAIYAYLGQLDARDPSEAPNFEYIPHIIDGKAPKNKNYQGLTGEELRKIAQENYCKRTLLSKMSIHEAHRTIKHSSN